MTLRKSTLRRVRVIWSDLVDNRGAKIRISGDLQSDKYRLLPPYPS